MEAKGVTLHPLMVKDTKLLEYCPWVQKQLDYNHTWLSLLNQWKKKWHSIWEMVQVMSLSWCQSVPKWKSSSRFASHEDCKSLWFSSIWGVLMTNNLQFCDSLWQNCHNNLDLLMMFCWRQGIFRQVLPYDHGRSTSDDKARRLLNNIEHYSDLYWRDNLCY